MDQSDSEKEQTFPESPYQHRHKQLRKQSNVKKAAHRKERNIKQMAP